MVLTKYSVTVLDQIREYARDDIPASTAAALVGLTYYEMAKLIRNHNVHATYSSIRDAEQQRALGRIFSTTESEPPLPPIPSQPRKRKEKA